MKRTITIDLEEFARMSNAVAFNLLRGSKGDLHKTADDMIDTYQTTVDLWNALDDKKLAHLITEYAAYGNASQALHKVIGLVNDSADDDD